VIDVQSICVHAEDEWMQASTKLSSRPWPPRLTATRSGAPQLRISVHARLLTDSTRRGRLASSGRIGSPDDPHSARSSDSVTELQLHREHAQRRRVEAPASLGSA